MRVRECESAMVLAIVGSIILPSYFTLLLAVSGECLSSLSNYRILWPTSFEFELVNESSVSCQIFFYLAENTGPPILMIKQKTKWLNGKINEGSCYDYFVNYCIFATAHSKASSLIVTVRFKLGLLKGNLSLLSLSETGVVLLSKIVFYKIKKYPILHF